MEIEIRNKNLNDFQKQLVLNVSFYALLILLLVWRTLTVLNVTTVYFDSDQPFMWLGAHDFAKGIFMEPRFYGQDYNTFIEGLIAVPLLWCRVPVYYALPISTQILFLFPILFSAFYLFFQQRKQNAIILLALFNCLPLAFDIMTGLPRGLITGLFFTSFYVINVIHPNKERVFVLNTVLSVIGYFINPNLIIVAVPFYFFMFLNHYQSIRFYLIVLVCATLYFPLDWMFNGFYLRHPTYVVYGLEYAVSPMYFWKTFSRPNEIFTHLNFFIEGNCYILFTVYTSLMIVLYRKHKKSFYTSLLFIPFLLATFCMSKTWDGTTWPFYSFSRMYIGIPFVMFLLTAVIPFKKIMFSAFLTFVCFVFFGFKTTHLQKDVEHSVDKTRWGFVHLMKRPNAIEAITFYKNVCDQNQVKHLFVSTGFFLNTFISYGGPAIYPDYPITQESVSERRYWAKEATKYQIIPSFIYIANDFNLDQHYQLQEFKLKRLDDYGLYLVTENTLPTSQFFKTVSTIENEQ